MGWGLQHFEPGNFTYSITFVDMTSALNECSFVLTQAVDRLCSVAGQIYCVKAKSSNLALFGSVRSLFCHR